MNREKARFYVLAHHHAVRNRHHLPRFHIPHFTVIVALIDIKREFRNICVKLHIHADIVNLFKSRIGQVHAKIHDLIVPRIRCLLVIADGKIVIQLRVVVFLGGGTVVGGYPQIDADF